MGLSIEILVFIKNLRLRSWEIILSFAGIVSSPHETCINYSGLDSIGKFKSDESRSNMNIKIIFHRSVLMFVCMFVCLLIVCMYVCWCMYVWWFLCKPTCVNTVRATLCLWRRCSVRRSTCYLGMNDYTAWRKLSLIYSTNSCREQAWNNLAAKSILQDFYWEIFLNGWE